MIFTHVPLSMQWRYQVGGAEHPPVLFGDFQSR